MSESPIGWLLDTMARQHGFESAADMERCVAQVNLSAKDQLLDYVRWLEEGGTKTGLLRLFPQIGQG